MTLNWRTITQVILLACCQWWDQSLIGEKSLKLENVWPGLLSYELASVLTDPIYCERKGYMHSKSIKAKKKKDICIVGRYMIHSSYSKMPIVWQQNSHKQRTTSAVMPFKKGTSSPITYHEEQTDRCRTILYFGSYLMQ